MAEESAPLEVTVNLHGGSDLTHRHLTVTKEPGKESVVTPITAIITAKERITLDYIVAELFANDDLKVVQFFRDEQPSIHEIAPHPQVQDAFARGRAVEHGSPLTLTPPTDGIGPYKLGSGRAGVAFVGGITLEAGQRVIALKGASKVSYRIEAPGNTSFVAVAHAFMGSQPIPVSSAVGGVTVNE